MSQARHSDAPTTPDPQSGEPSLHEAAGQVLAAVRRQLAELLELFTLEIRYSVLMLGGVIALATIAGLALFSLWGLLLASAVAGLLASGWSWTAALGLVAVANGVILFGSLWLMLGSLGRIGAERTRYVLGLEASNVPRL